MSLRNITSRHWRRLAKFVGITSEDMISKISNENYGMLFDIESMISEWMEGSDKKEKRKMDKILRSASRKDTKGTLSIQGKKYIFCTGLFFLLLFIPNNILY